MTWKSIFDVLDDETISNHSLNGVTYFCTDYQFYMMERAESIKHEIMERNPVLTTERLNQLIEEEMKKRDYINGPLKDELDMYEVSPEDK